MEMGSTSTTDIYTNVYIFSIDEDETYENNTFNTLIQLEQ
jgi:hypothetical protein